MVISGLISGLAAQSELTRLLGGIYGGGNDLLDELYENHDLTSMNDAGKDTSTTLLRVVLQDGE